MARIYRLNIAARLWLSVGIFAGGFLATNVIGQMDRRRSERVLARIADEVMPALQSGRLAGEALRRMTHDFGEDQRADGDERVQGLSEGRTAIIALHRLAGIDPDAPEADRAVRLAADISSLLGNSERLPGRVLSELSEALSQSLMSVNNDLAGKIERQMAELRVRSARVREVNLWIFFVSSLFTGLLVNWTIRRGIVMALTRAENALARESDLLRSLLDNIPDSIYFKDAESRFIRINKAQAETLGIDDPAKAKGLTDRDFFSSEMAEESMADERRIVESGEPVMSKIELISRPGLMRWVAATKVPVRNQAGEVTGIVGVSRDVTAWKEAVDALEESEQTFRLLFDSIPHAVWVYDWENLRCVAVNKAAVSQYGYTSGQYYALRYAELHPPDEAERFLKLRETNPKLLSGAWKHQTQSGSPIDVEVVSHELEFSGRRSVLVVAQDVSERNRLQLELHQAQRLEAVGQLAAGIAHEINTPIQYVGDNLRFVREAFFDRSALLERYSELRSAAEREQFHLELVEGIVRRAEDIDVEYLNSEIPKALEQSLEGVDRVAVIVKAMKAFAHPGQKQRAAADLNKCLSDALIVARNEIKYVADVQTQLADIPPVICHIADINQVLLNLLVNAADAIREVHKTTGQRGLIRVVTERDGDRVVITIADSGCGIPASIRERVFDPFFTTKDVGQGTGQGLAIARTIIEKHCGSISFAENPDGGTIFRVVLPIGQADLDSASDATSYAA